MISDYEYVYEAERWLLNPDRDTSLNDLRLAREIIRPHHAYAAVVLGNLVRAYVDGWPVPSRSAEPLAAYLHELARVLEGRSVEHDLYVAEAIYAEHLKVGDP